jgi:hypothetical protein
MGHRRSGRRLGNQRRVSRVCIRSFARRIRIAPSDPDRRYGVHTHVNTRHFPGEFIFNLCRNFALILIISVRAENTVFLWTCGRDAASEVSSVGKTEPTPSFRHLVQRRLCRAKARFSPTALIKKKRQRTSCPLLPICLKPISSVQPNASCDHSVKQERAIATRIGLGHNTFPTPLRVKQLVKDFAEDEVITGAIDSEETRSPRWRLSIQTLARTHNLESVDQNAGLVE